MLNVEGKTQVTGKNINENHARFRVSGLALSSVAEELSSSAHNPIQSGTQENGRWGKLGECRRETLFLSKLLEKGKIQLDAQLHLETYGQDLLYGEVFAQARSWEWWDGLRFGLNGVDTLRIALSLPGFKRGLGAAMDEEWWTQPYFVTDPGQLPRQTQFLLWEEKDGSYGVLVPLCGGDGTTLLEGGAQGLQLHFSTECQGLLQAKAPCFLAAFGNNPYELVQKAYAAALERLNYPARLRTQKKYPEAFEYLGWCTWDAFYHDLSAEKILKQLDYFKSQNLPLGMVLIDDGWQSYQKQLLTALEEDRTKLPEGMKALVQKIKENYQIPYVGVWHAYTAYWMGIDPASKLALEEKDHLDKLKNGYVIPALDEARAFGFWDRWHSALAADGVDFVKVDVQGAIHRYSKDVVPISRGAQASQRALQASVGINFRGQILNCMAMRQELVWNWQMSNLARSSHDFRPRQEISSAEHARQNVYNSIWISQIAWCDWDMWWSRHAHAPYQQVLRAVSGGPVYISDEVGKSDAEILKPLALSTGRLLRCDEVGMPTLDCLFEDPAKSPQALKVKNTASGAGILGLFHAQATQEKQRATFVPSDACGQASEEYAVWSYHQKAGKVLGRQQSWSLELAPFEASLFVIRPVRAGFAPIGNVNKLVAPKTIRHWSLHEREAVLLLEEGGHFAAYCQHAPKQVLVAGKATAFEHKDGWVQVDVPGSQAVELRILW